MKFTKEHLEQLKTCKGFNAHDGYREQLAQLDERCLEDMQKRIDELNDRYLFVFFEVIKNRKLVDIARDLGIGGQRVGQIRDKIRRKVINHVLWHSWNVPVYSIYDARTRATTEGITVNEAAELMKVEPMVAFNMTRWRMPGSDWIYQPSGKVKPTNTLFMSDGKVLLSNDEKTATEQIQLVNFKTTANRSDLCDMVEAFYSTTLGLIRAGTDPILDDSYTGTTVIEATTPKGPCKLLAPGDDYKSFLNKVSAVAKLYKEKNRCYFDVGEVKDFMGSLSNDGMTNIYRAVNTLFKGKLLDTVPFSAYMEELLIRLAVVKLSNHV